MNDKELLIIKLLLLFFNSSAKLIFNTAKILELAIEIIVPIFLLSIISSSPTKTLPVISFKEYSFFLSNLPHH